MNIRCALSAGIKKQMIFYTSISRGYYILYHHHSLHNIFESEKRREGELGALNVRVQECARVYERAE